jgi:hypothetical protein
VSGAFLDWVYKGDADAALPKLQRLQQAIEANNVPSPNGFSEALFEATFVFAAMDDANAMATLGITKEKLKKRSRSGIGKGFLRLEAASAFQAAPDVTRCADALAPAVRNGSLLEYRCSRCESVRARRAESEPEARSIGRLRVRLEQLALV